MSILHVGQNPGPVGDAARLRGFWRGLARVIDAIAAERANRAVPPSVLRRSKYEISRCRRLMLGRSRP